MIKFTCIGRQLNIFLNDVYHNRKLCDYSYQCYYIWLHWKCSCEQPVMFLFLYFFFIICSRAVSLTAVCQFVFISFFYVYFLFNCIAIVVVSLFKNILRLIYSEIVYLCVKVNYKILLVCYKCQCVVSMIIPVSTIKWQKWINCCSVDAFKNYQVHFYFEYL